jgi:hypothetical protein
MAATSGKISFAVSATPIETVSSLSTEATAYSVASGECFGSVGGSGDVTGVSYVDAGGANDGYASGSAYYDSAPAQASGSGDALTSLASCRFLFIKHTGFQGGSSGAKSDTANTTDYLNISMASGNVVIARLKSGEAIMLPLRGATNISSFEIASTNSAGSAGANSIAVEMIAVA